MKKWLLFLATSILAMSFVWHKKKEFTPPGCIQLNDSLYIDETEITNLSWLEYEIWNKNMYGKNSPQHLASMPDTTVWQSKLTYNQPYVQYYYRHPAYKNYPVVGVSYDQAKAFCLWRTERVKEFLSIAKKFGQMNFEYRLPNKQEWENAVSNSVGFMNHQGRDKGGMPKLNCILTGDTIHQQYENSDITAPVNAYWKNNFGIYNMLGNVSEMVLEKGISKGGSWIHHLEDCRPGKDQVYEKPEPWLGFRCVCVVKKKNNY